MGTRNDSRRCASKAEQLDGGSTSAPAWRGRCAVSRLVNGLAVMALAAAMLVVTSASPASAATTTTTLQEVPGTQTLFDVACSTPTTCVAVGGDTVVLITNGIAGPAQVVPSFLDSVACASATTCYAVGGNQVLVITSGVPGTSQPVPGGATLTDIACSSTTTCVAVGNNAVVLITNGVAGPPQTVEGMTIDDPLYDVACSDATTCYAVGLKFGEFPQRSGVLVAITNGVPGPAQVVADTESLRAIDCASATTCYAAGDGTFPDFLGTVVVPIVDGTTGPLQLIPFPGPFPASGLACASPTTCVVVGFGVTGSVVPIVNGIPGPEEAVPVGGFSGADCASVTICYAAGVTETGSAVVATITLSVDGTSSLTCTRGTRPSGTPRDVCKVSDPDGLHSIVVKNTTTDRVQTSVGYSCAQAPKSTRFRVPAGTRYKVIVTDCHKPGNRTIFVVNADGSVNQV